MLTAQNEGPVRVIVTGLPSPHTCQDHTPLSGCRILGNCPSFPLTPEMWASLANLKILQKTNRLLQTPSCYGSPVRPPGRPLWVHVWLRGARAAPGTRWPCAGRQVQGLSEPPGSQTPVGAAPSCQDRTQALPSTPPGARSKGPGASENTARKSLSLSQVPQGPGTLRRGKAIVRKWDSCSRRTWVKVSTQDGHQ